MTAAPLATDTKLAKALDYFNHAQCLGKVRNDLLFGYPMAHGYLIADIFLNYYKAASVIVGDPSKDRDWQSRHKKIGLSDGFRKEIEYVRKLRNDYGVAHYDLDGKQLAQKLATAGEVAKTVINHYIASLQPKEAAQNRAVI